MTDTTSLQKQYGLQITTRLGIKCEEKNYMVLREWLKAHINRGVDYGNTVRYRLCDGIKFGFSSKIPNF